MGTIVSVNFRGDELYGFENDDGTFVALKPMVEAMGLDWSAQYRRTMRDPILAEGIAVMATPFGRGGSQECVCLKIDRVNGWLFGISSPQIKDDAVREKVQLYQRECFQVLHDHFTGKAGKRHDEIEGEPDDELTINDRRALVTEARQTFGQIAGREVWFKMKLPIVPSMLKPEGQAELFSYSAIRHPDKVEDAA